jgi:pantoate--beta-alanine ligase
VIRRMVADLPLPLEIVGIETVREADGLAMSSRNRFLSAADRAKAPTLNRTLRGVSEALRAGRQPASVLADATSSLTSQGFGVDYLALVDGPTLVPVDQLTTDARLITAATLGSVRLLDNIAA